MLALVSCQMPFEKTYELSVDSNEYVVSINGKTFPIYVYCSHDWTASFDQEVTWIEILEGKTGSGIGMVKIHAQANNGEARSVNLVLKSGESEQIVLIRQNEFAVDYYATFESKEMTIASGSYLAKVRFKTNIPPTVLAGSRAVSDVDWISGITTYNVLSDDQVIGTNRVVEAEYSFVVNKNDSGADRTAVFSIGVPEEYTEGMERVQSLRFIQSSKGAFIDIEQDVISCDMEAAGYSVAISTNLLPVSHDVNVVAEGGFIDNAVVSTNAGVAYLHFNLGENKTGAERKGTISLSHRDLTGKIVSGSVQVQQK